jgi:hypothetical protein
MHLRSLMVKLMTKGRLRSNSYLNLLSVQADASNFRPFDIPYVAVFWAHSIDMSPSHYPPTLNPTVVPCLDLLHIVLEVTSYFQLPVQANDTTEFLRLFGRSRLDALPVIVAKGRQSAVQIHENFLAQCVGYTLD